jgi:hypothetical protein
MDDKEQQNGWLIRDGLTKHGLMKLSAGWHITRDQVVSIITKEDKFVLIFEPTPEQRELEQRRRERRQASRRGASAVGGTRRMVGR